MQQLCEAGEEEFLEIMQLIGMASKPLHVRRLQKALQEWMTNPGKHQSMKSLATSSKSNLPVCLTDWQTALFQSPSIAPFSSSNNSSHCPVSSATSGSTTSRPTASATNLQPSNSRNSPSPSQFQVIKEWIAKNI